MCDLFFTMNETDFANNNVDDNTPFVTWDSIDGVVKSLENDSVKPVKWFADKQMKANMGNCHQLISTNESSTINVDSNTKQKSNWEKILFVKVGYKLNFNKHVGSIIKKAYH